ncbi:hypothetical protein L1887_16750 [Cichorium endivia]|nr:hypothetical protein L1887_16750 [Cichorium endivia]
MEALIASYGDTSSTRNQILNLRLPLPMTTAHHRHLFFLHRLSTFSTPPIRLVSPAKACTYWTFDYLERNTTSRI